MNKFLTKIVLFFHSLLFCGVIIEFGLRNIPNDYSQKLKNLTSVGEKLEVLVLGDSQLYCGINPSYLELRSFNNAHIAQTLDQDLELFKKYIDQLSSLRFVIVPLSINSLYSSSLREDEVWRHKNYAIYYGLNCENFRMEDYSELFSRELEVNLKRLINYFLFDEDEIYSDHNGFGTIYSKTSHMDFTLTARLAVNRLRLEKGQEKINFNDLEEIIRLARNRKIKVVLISPPVTEDYRSLIRNSLAKEVLSLGRELDYSDTGITYLDFYSCNEFSEMDFYDADHLNAQGAKKLSKLVNNELKAL